MITKAGEANGITKPGTSDRIANVLKKYDLMTEDCNSVEDIISAMSADKKRTSDSIKFTLLTDIGDSFNQGIKYREIPRFFGIE